jgi:tRNA-dihydrouridine synthase A
MDETQAHLQHVDGVMVGREAYQNPWLLAAVDQALYAQVSGSREFSRHTVMEAMLPYIDRCLAEECRNK